jgi:hypothetical protein
MEQVDFAEKLPVSDVYLVRQERITVISQPISYAPCGSSEQTAAAGDQLLEGRWLSRHADLPASVFATAIYLLT